MVAPGAEMKKLLIVIEVLCQLIGLVILFHPKFQSTEVTQAVITLLVCVAAIAVIAALALVVAIVRSQLEPPVM